MAWKPYKLTTKRIHKIMMANKNRGKGRRGYAAVIKPFQECKPAVQNPGAKIARQLHLVGKEKKNAGVKDATIFWALFVENGKPKYLIRTESDRRFKTAVELFKANLAGLTAEDASGQYFIDLDPGDYAQMSFIVPNGRREWPLAVPPEEGEFQHHLLSACQPDEEGQKFAVIARLTPVKKSKLRALKNAIDRKYERGKTTQTDAALAAMEHKYEDVHYEAAIKVLTVGKDPGLIPGRRGAIASRFTKQEPPDNAVEYTKFKEMPHKWTEFRFINMMEDYNEKLYPGRGNMYETFIMSAEEVGKLFFSFPIEKIPSLESSKYLCPSVPDEVLKAQGRRIGRLRRLNIGEELTPQELQERAESYREKAARRDAREAEIGRMEKAFYTVLENKLRGLYVAPEDETKAKEFTDIRGSLFSELEEDGESLERLEEKYVNEVASYAELVGWDEGVVSEICRRLVIPQSIVKDAFAKKKPKDVEPSEKISTEEFFKKHESYLKEKEREELKKKDWLQGELIKFKGKFKDGFYTAKEERVCRKLIRLRKQLGRDFKYLFDKGDHPYDYPKKEFKLMAKILQFQKDPENQKTDKLTKFYQRETHPRSEYYYLGEKKRKSYPEIIEEYVSQGKIVIGWGEDRYGKIVPIALPIETFFTHVGIFAGTGYGKTTLLGQIARQLVMARIPAVFAFDVKGDLIFDELMPYLPESLIEEKKIVIIAPVDIEKPVSINPLVLPMQKKLEKSGWERAAAENLLRDNLVDLIKRTHPTEYSTPGMDKHLSGIFGMLIEISSSGTPTTFIDGVKILHNRPLRWRLANLLTTPVSRDYMMDQLAMAVEEDLLSTENRLIVFHHNIFLKASLCKRTDTIDFAELVNPGMVVLVDLRKSAIGGITSRILGTIYLTLLWITVKLKKGKKTILEKKAGEAEADFPVFAVLDEFQTFITSQFTDLLNEARSFGLGLILATQFIEQIGGTTKEGEQMRKSVIDNITTFIALSSGADQAPLLSRMFECDPLHVQRLNPFEFYCRTKIGDKKTDYFFGKLYRPCRKVPAHMLFERDIINFSREHWGRQFDPVDTSIFSTDIKEVEDWLKGMYTLAMKEKQNPSFPEVKAEIENISNLPNLLQESRLKNIAVMCAQRGWVKAELDEKLAEEIHGKDKTRAYRYSLTQSGLQRIAPHIGRGADAGKYGHKYYTLLLRDRLLLDGYDPVVINQDNVEEKAEYLPDLEQRIMPILDGRTASEQEAIKKCIRSKWLYRYAKGCDAVNFEIELSTVGRADWIVHNAVKALKQGRPVFPVTATEEDGERIVSILSDFVEHGCRSYRIDPKERFDERAIPRAPSHGDYQVAVLKEDKTMLIYDKKAQCFKPIKRAAPLTMSAAEFDKMKMLYPILELVMKQHKEAGEKAPYTIKIQEITSKTQGLVSGLATADILEVLSNCGVKKEAGTRPENAIFFIGEEVLDAMATTIEIEEEGKEPTLEALKKEYDEFKARKPQIEAKFDKEGMWLCEDEEECAVKSNLSKHFIRKMLNLGFIERTEDKKLKITAESLQKIEEHYTAQLEKERPEKENITFNNLVKNLDRWLKDRGIDKAYCVKFDLNKFYAEMALKKQYNIPKEVEKPFKAVIEKYLKDVNGVPSITRGIRKELREILESSELKVELEKFVKFLKEDQLIETAGACILTDEEIQGFSEKYAELIKKIFTKEFNAPYVETETEKGLYFTDEQYRELKGKWEIIAAKYESEIPEKGEEETLEESCFELAKLKPGITADKIAKIVHKPEKAVRDAFLRLEKEKGMIESKELDASGRKGYYPKSKEKKDEAAQTPAPAPAPTPSPTQPAKPEKMPELSEAQKKWILTLKSKIDKEETPALNAGKFMNMLQIEEEEKKKEFLELMNKLGFQTKETEGQTVIVTIEGKKLWETAEKIERSKAESSQLQLTGSFREEEEAKLEKELRALLSNNPNRYFKAAELAKELGIPFETEEEKEGLYSVLEKCENKGWLEHRPDLDSYQWKGEEESFEKAVEEEINEEVSDEQKSKRGRKKKEIDKDKIIRLKGEGKSVREIAKEVGISIGLVSETLKEVGLSSSTKSNGEEE